MEIKSAARLLKKPNYILYYNKNNPLAVVEAKDNNHSVSFGMQQAMLYAQMLDVKFAYSSNGDAFQEFDFITGVEREIGLDEFPSPEELFARYQKEINDGQGLSEAERTLINQPYYTSQNTYPPRYYQQVAINRTMDAIAKDQNRILLVMATGTGKTYTAFQIVYRLLQSGIKQKILYLADRNNLVDQTISGDFKPLEKVIHKTILRRMTAPQLLLIRCIFLFTNNLLGIKRPKKRRTRKRLLTISNYSIKTFSI